MACLVLAAAAVVACGRTGLSDDFGGGQSKGGATSAALEAGAEPSVSPGDDGGDTSGHDDGGGGAIVLAAYQYAPVCLAVDESTVYWCNYGTGAGDGYLMATAIGGGGKIRAVSSGGDDPWAAAVRNGVVYWSSYGSSGSDGSVKSAPVGGGFATTLATLQTFPYSIAVTDTDVYWTQRFDLDGTISDVDLAEPDTVITRANSLRYPTELAVRGDALFWTSYLGNGGVYTMPTSGSGGAFSTIESSEVFPFAVTTDAQNVYWATRDGLYQRPLGGGPVKQIAPAAQRIIDIASDGQRVYWGDYYANTVTSVAVGGGAVTTIASEQNGVRSVAVDAHNIYWVAYLDGTVMQKAK